MKMKISEESENVQKLYMLKQRGTHSVRLEILVQNDVFLIKTPLKTHLHLNCFIDLGSTQLLRETHSV